MINIDHMNFQRKCLGVLCALLAPSCILFGLLGDNLPGWYKSISATYYANSKICMIGLLFATSVFFLTYKGYDKWDTIFAFIQGLSCLGVILFPCNTPGIPDKVGLFNLPISMSMKLHCVSAGVLFVCFGLMILFLFTKGDINNEMKRKRNKVYYVCGTVIFIGCLGMTLQKYIPYPSWFPYTWLMEFIMLEAFAVAWIVKSESIKVLNDGYEKETK